MRDMAKLNSILLLLAITLLLSISTTLAQTGGEYDLTWATVNGGGVSNGGEFSLTGIIGQSDTDMLTGGDFSLSGGFLPRNDSQVERSNVYLPIILK